ncbi:hypothetical protein TNIN_424241 [Trichonephila inaurata madagascariensis]|uniref:Uncharacterized protein n=1 Tax=Trichonephila inaurata madagascariensis TaxID=2747483 RepID=A0A8X6XM25_9ARAC|nr:hypothetical protein TNIN_424241 [Trichonephila inaurata madagascariensis]
MLPIGADQLKGRPERKRGKVPINQGNKRRLTSSTNSIPNYRGKKFGVRKRQGQNKIHVGTIYGSGKQTELSPDHPVNKLKTKGDQSKPEEEEINSTDPTIRSKDASSSQQAKVVRRPREDGQAVTIQEAEEPLNNARKKKENRLVQGRLPWRS